LDILIHTIARQFALELTSLEFNLFRRVCNTKLCHHGNRPTSCWTILESGHASAKAHMYSGLWKENTFFRLR
jgi:hypothetical protein